MAVNKFKRLQMTLIEMVIVIAIIALVAGLLSYNVMGAVRQQRFLSDAGIVVDQLRLAQDLMLIMPGDFHVKMEPDKEGFRVWIDTDASLTKGWNKELKRMDRQLKAIRYAKFEDLLPHPTPKGNIDIRFLSGGSAMSKGLLRLSANPKGEGSLTQTICLYGYPHPIAISSDTKGDLSCSEKETDLYDEQLTRYTIEEVELVDLNYKRSPPKSSTKKDKQEKKDDKKKS